MRIFLNILMIVFLLSGCSLDPTVPPLVLGATNLAVDRAEKNSGESLDEFVKRTHAVIGITSIVGAYYFKNERWPTNTNELQLMVSSVDKKLDLSSFGEIEFSTRQDGGLDIRVTDTMGKDYTKDSCLFIEMEKPMEGKIKARSYSDKGGKRTLYNELVINEAL